MKGEPITGNTEAAGDVTAAVSSVVAKTVAGEEGLEPSHAGIKIRCLDQLGDSPTRVSSLIHSPITCSRSPPSQGVVIQVAADPTLPARGERFHHPVSRARSEHRAARACHARREALGHEPLKGIRYRGAHALRDRLQDVLAKANRRCSEVFHCSSFAVPLQSRVAKDERGLEPLIRGSRPRSSFATRLWSGTAKLLQWKTSLHRLLALAKTSCSLSRNACAPR